MGDIVEAGLQKQKNEGGVSYQEDEGKGELIGSKSSHVESHAEFRERLRRALMLDDAEGEGGHLEGLKFVWKV